jgi:bile acid:Na+ symporter, BASS family
MTDVVKTITHFVHRFFLTILIATYVLACVAPQLGDVLRHASIGVLELPGMGRTNLSVSLIMLSFLLFNAGLGIKATELLKLRSKPQMIVVGFLANMLIPIILIFTLRSTMGLWHNQDELNNVLVGMALIIAMPIAGSSVAWSQNANGNLSLSLGLVLLSTILSPFTTPLVLNAFGLITQGDYSEDLQEMAAQGTNTFLCLTVVIPSLLGMAAHYVLGEKRIDPIKPYLKLVNFIVLLALNYSNASASLPQAFRTPDWDFLMLILCVTFVVCLFAFFSGWLISWLFKTDQSDKAALMFSLGMNNNGTGIVLAATALADHPAVMLPMIFYTLVQQILAAVIDSKIFKSQS